MAGDKRDLPVLAFSNENSFDTNAEDYPSLLVKWLESSDDYIKEIRKDSTTKDLLRVKKEFWSVKNVEQYINYQSSNVKKSSMTSKSGCSIATLDLQYGPLTFTSWGQGVGYNDMAPNYGCSNYSNGRTPTGCVATAMSQIMRFHEHPNTYNWSSMPNSYGTTEIATLMRDAGDSVNMDWGCDGSGATTSDSVSALKNTFGYSSATYYDDFSVTLAKAELGLGYPIIIRGGESVVKWLIFNVYDNRHAWVCDGIKEYTVPVQIQAGRWGYITICSTAWTYHMNWGWSGSYNGWYSENFYVNGSSHRYQAGMIYNIRP